MLHEVSSAEKTKLSKEFFFFFFFFFQCLNVDYFSNGQTRRGDVFIVSMFRSYKASKATWYPTFKYYHVLSSRLQRYKISKKNDFVNLSRNIIDQERI